MIIEYSSKSVEAVRNALLSGAECASDPYSVSSPFFKKERMYGACNGGKLWLIKTKPSIINQPQRYFAGEILRDKGKTIITGHFKYSAKEKTVSAVFAAVMFVIFFLIFHDYNYSQITLLIVFLCMLIVCFIPYLIGLVIYRSAELDVIAHIKQAAK